MALLQINRVNFELSDKPTTLYFSNASSELLFRTQWKNLKKKFSYSSEFDEWRLSKKIRDDDFIFYGFSQPSGEFFQINNIQFSSIKGEYGYFKRKFVREKLVKKLMELGFIIQPYPVTFDLCAFHKLRHYDHEWEVFRRYDFIIKEKRNEIIFNIGSDKTLISIRPKPLNFDQVKVIDNDGFIKSGKERDQIQEYRLIANRDIKELLQFPHEVRMLNYKQLYDELMSFYRGHLLKINDEYLKIEAGGFKTVEPRDSYRINVGQNQMLFGRNQTDINPVSGMRDFGPFKRSEKATDNRFIFIYQNRDDANKLYFHFKNGLKHFPGLWSYVGIPVTLETDISLKYTDTHSLKEEFDSFIEQKLFERAYTNYFAIVIGPFDKYESDEEESFLYFYLKGKLLERGIPSQFVDYKGLRQGSFHYYLPNIAVAILAKLGGIPWKLKTKKQDELVVGFNQLKIVDERYIGSAVFFSNEGDLGSVVGYPESQSDVALIRHLRKSIEKYIIERKEPPERLVIHYYKLQSEKEQRSIEELIQDELRLNIPFAIVEINDTKSRTDICFDQDFNMGMPESGTYIKVGSNEYLLFNNTRYQKTPLRSVPEELPLKIKIHFADTGGFSHKELISQIYEFSRLYWKALKQKSQPVTTIYAKLIANFEVHFGAALPDNNITHEIPWFL